jgi:DNA polymerase-3 subunit epsilon
LADENRSVAGDVRIKYAALIDTETTGLDPARDRTIEVAVTLFDVKHAQPVASFASLIRGPAENEAQSTNGIPATMLPEAREAERVWSAVRWIIEPAQIIIAHHADFDRRFTPDFGRPWVCSEEDITWPNSNKGGRGGSLAHLALSLGLGVASAHRAMVDVDTLSRILTRLAEKGHDLEAMLVHAMRPKAMFHSLAPFEMKDVVKSHGFRWSPEEKIWWRRMAVDDAKELPFKVRQVAS